MKRKATEPSQTKPKRLKESEIDTSSLPMSITLADKVISKNELFWQMTDAQVVTILSKMKKKKSHKAGDMFLKQGAPVTAIYIVESGEVAKIRNGRKTILTSGDAAGMLHFFSRDAAAADLVVEKDGTEVWTMSSDDFHELLKSPGLIDAYIAFLNRKVRRGLNTISKLTEDGGRARVAFFDSKQFMKEVFENQNNSEKFGFSISWFDVKLSKETAGLASGHRIVCVFVNDHVDAAVLTALYNGGVEMLALRCAGFNNVDVKKAYELGMSVTRVPAYSPYSVAEFSVGLMLTLNRKLHKAHQRVTNFNFSLNGLVGFDMHGKTVGVFGTGKIGVCATDILLGFGCKILAVDVYQNEDLKKRGVKYVEKEELLANADIITLHAPLTQSTEHWLDAKSLAKCKDGVMIINTSRGPLIDTPALLEAILSGKVGAAGLDVIEHEEQYFYENLEMKQLHDNTLARLIACPNVVLTSHQAFLTREALWNIAESTLSSMAEFVEGKTGNQLKEAVKLEK